MIYVSQALENILDMFKKYNLVIKNLSTSTK